MKNKEEKKVPFNDLYPGDILMCVGINKLSKMIIALDGGKYSHAAICVDKDHFAHTSTEGAKKHSFSEREVLLDNKSEIDVFRFQFEDNGSDTSYAQLSESVLGRVNYYLESDTEYSYNRLILLAILTCCKKLDFKNKALNFKELTGYIDEASQWIVHTFKSKKKKTLICSEFVFRCYGEAESDTASYKLEINNEFPELPITLSLTSGFGFDFSPVFDEYNEPQKKEYVQFLDSRNAFIELLEEHTDFTFDIFQGDIAGLTFTGKSLDKLSAAYIVTPRNLAASPELPSPSLKYIGKLK